jgi:DNA topoisomerase-1
MPGPVAQYIRQTEARDRMPAEAGTALLPLSSSGGLGGIVPAGWGDPFRSALPRRPADWTRDQIRSDLFAPPYTDPQQLDPWAGETPEMMRAYLSLHRTEPVLRAAVDGKVKAIACLDVAVTPQDKESPRDREAAEYVDWAVKVNSRKGWDGLIFDVVRPAVMFGWSVTEKVLGPSDRMAPLKWKGRWALDHAPSKDIRHVRLQLDPYRNVVGVVSLVAGLEAFDPAKVILFTHDDLFANPYGQGDLRAAYRAAVFIEDAYKLWRVFLSNNNGPVVHGKASKQDQIGAMRQALELLRAYGVIATGKDDEIELLNFASQGSFEAFERFVDKQRQEICLAVRGAYLPFLEGSGTDNRGDTETQKGAASDPVEHMLAKSVGRVLTRQLAPDLVRTNFGPDVGIPIITLGGVSWGETRQQLDVVKTVMVDLGRPVSAKYIEQITSVPGPADEADTANAPSAGGRPGAAGPFGLVPGGEGDDLLGSLGMGIPPPNPSASDGQQPTQQFASPPRAGLVPQTGDPQHPGRWVRPDQADAGTKGQSNAKPDILTIGGEGNGANTERGLFGKTRDLGNELLNTKVGRLLQAAEQKLSIAAHKTRDIAVNAAKRRGMTDEQASRLHKTLAVADFLGGYIVGGITAATTSPLAGKSAAFLPSVSAVYLAYSAARDPAATWKAALEVVGNSSLDPQSLLKDLGAAWRGEGAHSAFAADNHNSPGWVDALAGLLDADPELADWRQAVFLAGLVASGDPDGSVELAGQAEPPGGTFSSRPDSLPVADIGVDPDRFQFRRNADGQDGTVKPMPTNRFDPTRCPPLWVWYDPAAGRYFVVDGHHRLEWAKRDGIDRVPVAVIDADTADEARSKGEVANRGQDRRAFAVDAHGNEHKGKGPGGGQFVPKGKGGGGELPGDERPNPKAAKPKAVRGHMGPATRIGVGKEAKVVMADGRAAPAHIKPSMVPPQWTDVTVAIDPKADLLVTGRDAKGRPKAVYSDAFHMKMAAIKFARVQEGMAKAKDMYAQNQANRSDPAHRENADCVWLMQEQATRPGSDKNTGAEAKAYGATTLEGRHVVRAKDGVRLQFIGKEGVYHDHLIRNPALAKMLTDRAKAAGPNGRLFDTDYASVAKYTKEKLDGGAFTPKDFRTMKATQLAIDAVNAALKPTTEKEYKAAVKEVAEKVSGVLGNRPKQALESYIAPEVFSGWRSALGHPS